MSEDQEQFALNRAVLDAELCPVADASRSILREKSSGHGSLNLVSSALSGKEFYIVDGTEFATRKHALKCILKHGGNVVDTLTDGCTVLCDRHCRSHFDGRTGPGNHLVLDISWIELCTNFNQPCPPHLVVYCPEHLREQIFSSFDEFGDSFTEPVTPEGLKALFDRLSPLPLEGDYVVNQEAYLHIKKKYRQLRDYWRFALKEMLILSRDINLPILTIARLYGARLTADKEMKGITHHLTDIGVESDNVKSCSPGEPITKSDLLERLRPYISKQTYNTFH